MPKKVNNRILLFIKVLNRVDLCAAIHEEIGNGRNTAFVAARSVLMAVFLGGRAVFMAQ